MMKNVGNYIQDHDDKGVKALDLAIGGDVEVGSQYKGTEYKHASLHVLYLTTKEFQSARYTIERLFIRGV